MSDVMTATAAHERPILFDVGGETVFGILTEPSVGPNGTCVLHLSGKGPSIATVGRGRMSVLLARRLAAFGYYSLRIEYVGTGDSTGPDHVWSLTDPRLGDPQAALAWLRQHGLTDLVLVGTCGGARLALEVARHHPEVRGVVLLLPPLRDSEPWRRYDTLPTSHLVRRLLQPRHLHALRDKGRRRMYLDRARSDVLAALPGKLRRRRHRDERGGRAGKFRWIGPDALHGLHELVERGVPILMFFGTEDNDYRDWVEATKGPAGSLLERAGDLIRVELVEGRYYERPSPETAERIVRALDEHIGTGSNGRHP